jgi:hypothetical protein
MILTNVGIIKKINLFYEMSPLDEIQFGSNVIEVTKEQITIFIRCDE